MTCECAVEVAPVKPSVEQGDRARLPIGGVAQRDATAHAEPGNPNALAIHIREATQVGESLVQVFKIFGIGVVDPGLLRFDGLAVTRESMVEIGNAPDKAVLAQAFDSIPGAVDVNRPSASVENADRGSRFISLRARFPDPHAAGKALFVEHFPLLTRPGCGAAAF